MQDVLQLSCLLLLSVPVQPNLVTFNTLIDVYGKLNKWMEAVRVVNNMRAMVCIRHMLLHNARAMVCTIMAIGYWATHSTIFYFSLGTS